MKTLWSPSLTSLFKLGYYIITSGSINFLCLIAHCRHYMIMPACVFLLFYCLF